MILRSRQRQQRLEQAVNVGCLEQIDASRHQGDALEGVVDGHAEMVAGGGVFAGQHHVAEPPGRGQLWAGGPVVPDQRAGQGHGPGDIQAEGLGFAVLAPPSGRLTGRTAGAGINRTVTAALFPRVGGLAGGGDVFAAAPAGINHAQRRKAGQGSLIVGEMLGLTAHRPFPVQSKPRQVVEQRPLEGRTAPLPVDVLEAHQKPPAASLGGMPGKQRRVGMTQMQRPGWAGREAGNDGQRRQGVPHGSRMTGGTGILSDGVQ